MKPFEGERITLNLLGLGTLTVSAEWWREFLRQLA